MAQEWMPIKFDAEGQPAAFGWVENGVDNPNYVQVGDSWAEKASLPKATVGSRLVPYTGQQVGNWWWNTGQDGDTTLKAYSPSGGVTRLVMGPDGSPMVELPSDWQAGGHVTDSSASMGALGHIGSLFSGPIGMAAGAAFLPGLLGGNSALGAGLDTSGFGAYEAGAFNAGSAGGAAGSGLAADLAGATGGATNPAYTYDPGGATTPFGPMDNGLNLSDYNLNGNGADFGPFLPNTTGSQFNPNGFNEPAIDVNTGLPATPNPGGGVGGNVYSPTSSNATGLSALLRSAGILGADTANDGLIDAAGRLAPGLLGAFAANAQGNALSNLASQYASYGAPSRARFEASMTPGFDVTSIPGYSGAVDNSMNAMLRKLSTSGNPFGNPGGLIEANKAVVQGTALPALQEYQRMNANSGGLSNMNAAVPGLQAGAIESGNKVAQQLGFGLANAFNPQPQQKSLAEVLKSYTLP